MQHPQLSKLDKIHVHEKYLKLGIDHGLVMGHMHNVIRFNQSTFLKPYIDFNTMKRTEAKKEFEKDVFKLMSIAVYGKILENMRNRTKIY